MNEGNPYQDIADLPGIIPLFPLPGALLLPRGFMPLNIFEPRYVSMANNAMTSERLIGMIQPKTDQDAELIDDPGLKPELQNIGSAGRITSFAETPDGRILITLTGIARFAVLKELDSPYPYRLANVDFESYERDLDIGHGGQDVDRQKLIDVFRNFAEKQKLKIDWTAIEKASTEILVNGLSMAAPFGLGEKQALLEADSLKARAEILILLVEMSLTETTNNPRSIQ